MLCVKDTLDLHETQTKARQRERHVTETSRTEVYPRKINKSKHANSTQNSGIVHKGKLKFQIRERDLGNQQLKNEFNFQL